MQNANNFDDMKAIPALTSLFILFAVASSCSNGSGESVQTASAAIAPQSKPQVQEDILVSKGVIKSNKEIPVYSRITGQLNEVRLTDGQRVRKGELLFSLDDRELKAKVELTEAELEQAGLILEEILIGQGYRRDEFDRIPENIYNLAKVRSGYNVKEKELEIARSRYESAAIKAPLSGVIANVAPTSYAFVNPGETLCKIVDTEDLMVEFSILETEIRRFNIGDIVKVSSIAFSEQSHDAEVTTLGSIVNEAGMVLVQARITDTQGLMPGMTAIIRL